MTGLSSAFCSIDRKTSKQLTAEKKIEVSKTWLCWVDVLPSCGQVAYSATESILYISY